MGLREGFRIYHGIGLVIPSKATLSDPFDIPPVDSEDLKIEKMGEFNHRHFNLSNGVYKTSLETQIL